MDAIVSVTSAAEGTRASERVRRRPRAWLRWRRSAAVLGAPRTLGSSAWNLVGRLAAHMQKQRVATAPCEPRLSHRKTEIMSRVFHPVLGQVSGGRASCSCAASSSSGSRRRAAGSSPLAPRAVQPDPSFSRRSRRPAVRAEHRPQARPTLEGRASGAKAARRSCARRRSPRTRRRCVSTCCPATPSSRSAASWEARPHCSPSVRNGCAAVLTRAPCRSRALRTGFAYRPPVAQGSLP